MLGVLLVTATALLVYAALSGTSSQPAPRAASTAHGGVRGDDGIAFEPSAGRFGGGSRFVARGNGYSLWLTDEAAVLGLHSPRADSALRFGLVGGRTRTPQGVQQLRATVNSYVGERSKWRTGLPTYGRVHYPSVYPGIDLDYYGRDGRLEYDFVAKPGSDPAAIALSVAGARRISLTPGGDVLLRTAAGTLRQARPVAYQEQGGTRTPVPVRYVTAGRQLRLKLGSYDKRRTLTVDPVLEFSTFLGGGAADDGTTVAASATAVVVGGRTESANLPAAGASVPPGSIARQGTDDGFLTKYDTAGHRIWSTYFGGDGEETVRDMAIAPNGDVVFVGETSSSSASFPTSGAIDATYNGAQDAFVARLNSAATALRYSTFLGGASEDAAWSVAVTTLGTVTPNYTDITYVAGDSNGGFPTLGTPYQGTYAGNRDAFVARINTYVGRTPPATNPQLGWATYLGGGVDDSARGIDVDTTGNPVVTGTTNSSDFDTAGTSPDTSLGGTSDAFLTRIPGQTGSSLATSTYVGGAGSDSGEGVALDKSNNAYVTGISTSSDFPTAHTPSGQGAFLAKYGTGNVISASRVVDASGYDQAFDVAVDPQNNPIIVGTTSSTDFPTVNGLPGEAAPDQDHGSAWATKFMGSALGTTVYQLTIGDPNGTNDTGADVAVASDGTAYFTGHAAGQGFRTVNADDATYNGNEDAYLFKLAVQPATISSGPNSFTADAAPSFAFSADTGSLFDCAVDNAAPTTACNAGSFGAATLGDGPHTFYVVAKDAGGTPSAAVQRTFSVDTQGPSAPALIAPAPDVTTSDARPAFSWHLSTDAGAGLARYELLVDDRAPQAVPCATDPCSAQPDAVVGDGTHKWSVRAVDNVENTSVSEVRSFTQAVPPTAAMVISPNPALSGLTVTFDGSGSVDANGPIARFEWDLDGDGSFETDTAAKPTASRKYDLPGTVAIKLRVTDGAGQTAEAAASLKVSNSSSVLKQLGVTINNGAQYTNNPDVQVSTFFPASTTNMLFSNDGGFLKAQAFPPKEITPWKLDSSGPERLPKTIYVRFLNGPIVSETFTDDIILDETPPKVLSASLVTPLTSTANAARAKAVVIKLKATDNVSGVAAAQVAANKKRPGKFVKYKKRLKVKVSGRKLFVRVRDRAGNRSSWRRVR
ncbi:MAG: hypothetical protein QOJ29_3856 [Thermoleophilaceae bacterium]|nr:hypothetical protein [Thermoleophilaceae bacterium]